MKAHHFFGNLEHMLTERISRPARVMRLVFILSFLPAYTIWVLRDGLSWVDALPLPAALSFAIAQLLGRRKRSFFNPLSVWSGCSLIILVIIATGRENSPFLFLFFLPTLSYGLEKDYPCAKRAFLVNSAFYLLLIVLSFLRGNLFSFSYLIGTLISGYAMMKTLDHNLGFLEWQIRILSKQAFRDPLTGLLNRAALQQAALEFITRKIPFALLLADLDGFKRYNDRKGHLAGDKILREVARVLQESFRSQDLIFRYGGDELLVLIPEGDPALAEELTQRLKRNLQLALEGEVGISCGFSLFPQEAKTLKNLLQVADERLYEEKARVSPEHRRTAREDTSKKES
ncbi:GGDEF domain-containing protein [Atrimonas thermophila]|uniref:GGDEF domain-containing protein n=1 Tax=Atrimonas thermophila TaxID=3064161 RepID=UPI00399CF52F